MLLPPPHPGHTWKIYLKGVSFDVITTNFGPPAFTEDRRILRDSVRVLSSLSAVSFVVSFVSGILS